MEIEKHLHTADEIASIPANVEIMESYEEQIPWYQSQNFTYIPLPKAGRYYSTSEGWLKSIDGEQIIDVDTHIMEVLRRMQHHPFLLIDRETDEEYYVFEGEDESTAVQAYFAEKIIDEEAGLSWNIDVDIGQSVEEQEPLGVHEFREKYPDMAEDYLTYTFEEQYGIITLVDLNKRGVKQMLYKVISELSAGLSSKIEGEYESKDIFGHLRPATIGRWKKDRLEGLNMHIAEHMNLLEMMQVIQGSDSDFVGKCGLDSKSDVETLNEINEIRNRVMHANRSLIYDRKEIAEVIEVVNESQRISSSLD